MAGNPAELNTDPPAIDPAASIDSAFATATERLAERERIEAIETARQRHEIARVAARISAAVCDYLAELGAGGEFHLAELTAAVLLKVGTAAPDSPGRILRQLRRRGSLAYTVVDRPASRYRFDGFAVKQKTLFDRS